MSKKALDGKEAETIIKQKFEEGKTDQQVYNELSQSYADKKKLVWLVTGTVRPELKERYKSLNNLLVGLLAAAAITKILLVATIAIGTQEPWLMLMVLWAPVVNLYGVYYVSRYMAAIYRFCGGLAIVSALDALKSEGGVADIVFTILFAIAIAALSFYLDKKLFPNYKPFSLKKDDAGKYIIEPVTA